MSKAKKIRTFDDFLELLQDVTQTGSRKFTSVCPAHNNNNKRLNITPEKGKIFLRCEGGCLPENVVSAMGLTMDDLNLNGRGFGEIDVNWIMPQESAKPNGLASGSKEARQPTTTQSTGKKANKTAIRPSVNNDEKQHKVKADTCQDPVPSTSCGTNGAVPDKAAPSELMPGDKLLDMVSEFLLKYVVLTKVQADAIVLWIVHTHTLAAADVTPYLHITSPEKRSGKTRLLEVLELLVHNPWFTERVTTAVLPRKVDKEVPTLLLDESDTAFNSDKEYAETLRGILNSGYRRGGKISVCSGQGANIGFKNLSTFCPKAIAGIGKLPDTVTDRSIVIILKRRTISEQVERFRRRKAEQPAQLLKDNLIALEATLTLTGAEPELPQELDDRAADSWEPLLAIADAVGGDWPEKARAAAIELSCTGGKEDQSLGIRLLADIKSIFEEKGADRLISADLLQELNAIEDAPWADIDHKQLTANKLARLLKPYGVMPKNIRQGKTVPKGYIAAEFADAWKRYAPAVTRTLPATAASSAINQERENAATNSDNSQNVAGNSQIQRTLESSYVAVEDRGRKSVAIKTDNDDRGHQLEPRPLIAPAEDIIKLWNCSGCPGDWKEDGTDNIRLPEELQESNIPQSTIDAANKWYLRNLEKAGVINE